MPCFSVGTIPTARSRPEPSSRRPSRYQEKFGRAPRFCLTSPQDAAELAEPSRKFPGEPPVTVRARGFIARWTFYVGEDAGEPAGAVEASAAA